MSQDERELALRLRFETARQDIQRAKADFAAIKSEVEKLAKEGRSAEQVMKDLKVEAAKIGRERQIDTLVKEFAKLPPELRESKEEAEKLAASLAKIGATEDEVRRVARAVGDIDDQVASGGGGGGRSRGAVSRFGQEIRALPAVPLTSNLSSDAIGKVIAILGGLNPVAIGAAAGLAALVIGLKSSTSGIEQFTKALIASQENVYRLLVTGTREQVQEAIKLKEQEVEITRRRIEENKRVLDTFDQEVGGVGRAIADALDLGGAQALRVETQKLEEEERALALELQRLGVVLNTAEVAANTAAETEARLAEERIKAAEEAAKELNRLLDASVNAELQARLAADRFTEQQAKERIAAAEREQEIIRGILQQGGGSEENIKKLNEQLADLGQEILTLSGELPRLRIRDSINETIEGLQEQRKAQLALNEALDQINTNLDDKAADLEREQNKAITKAKADADKAELDAFKKKQDALDKLEVDATEKRIKILNDFHKAERKAIRDFNRDSGTAIAERDALAFVQAEQRKNDEIEAAKEARKEGLDELGIDLKRQQAAIEKAYNDQLTVINERLTEQTNLAVTRYNEQLTQAQTAADKQRQIEQQKYSQQIQLTAQGSAAVNAIFAQFWNTAAALAKNGLNALSGSSGVLGTIGNLLSSFAGKALLPKFDTGGMVTKSGLAFVDQNEIILNPRQQSRMGGITANINISGMSREDVKRQFWDQLDSALDQAQWGNA
jgi:hypothetical protein